MSDGKVEYEVRANYDRIDSDLNESGSRIEKSTSKWSSMLQGVGVGVGNFIAEGAVKAASAVWELGTAFEDGLAKVSTLVDTASVDMGALGDSLLELSSKYGLEASGLAESAYNAISANNALAEDSAGLLALLESSAKLAKAGFTDVDTATSATLKTLNAYGFGVEEADRIQKVLIQTQNTGITTVGELGAVLSNVTPTAAAMGVSFENVGAAIATMTAKGTPAAQATTQLNSLMAELGKSGTTAAKNLAEAAEGSKYAGMSFQEMTAAGVPLNEILALMEQYAGANDKTLLDMFSSIEAGKAALAMTGAGAQSFTNNLEAMSTQTDVVAEGFDKVSGTASERMNQSLTKIKNASVGLYDALSPLLTILLNIASVLIDKVSGAIQTVTGWIGDFAQGVSDLWSRITGGGSKKKENRHSHAVGIDYVPEDDYPATLHRGEMVLKAPEAKMYRQAKASGFNTFSGSIDYDRLAYSMSGLTVVMSDEVVGRIVEKPVSAKQARRAESIRRSGFNGKL